MATEPNQHDDGRRRQAIGTCTGGSEVWIAANASPGLAHRFSPLAAVRACAPRLRAPRWRRLAGASALAALVAACASPPQTLPSPPIGARGVAPVTEPPPEHPTARAEPAPPAPRRQARPPRRPAPSEAELARLPDPVPRYERPMRSANQPYVMYGRAYAPMSEPAAFRQRGEASWYGRPFHGRRTATGEVYDMYRLTAAHPTLPLPSYARVTDIESGRSVIVRVNDRGPFHGARVIDLSYAAAVRLGIAQQGTSAVEVELILASDADAVSPEARLARAESASESRSRARVKGFVNPPAADDPRWDLVGSFGSLAMADAARLRAQVDAGYPADMLRLAFDGVRWQLLHGPLPRVDAPGVGAAHDARRPLAAAPATTAIAAAPPRSDDALVH